ncbi:MAG: PAS domain-containing sensor histidine kinase [Cyanobacteria bacterium REEB67]|nr:PAS domain-containing sensor histidine kinase [Cyanobacteria bacterium REEB67]
MKNNLSKTGSLWDLSTKSASRPEEDNLVQKGWQTVASLSSIFGQVTDFTVGAPLILQALAPFDFAASTLWLLERNSQLRCISAHVSQACLIEGGQKVLPLGAGHLACEVFRLRRTEQEGSLVAFPLLAKRAVIGVIVAIQKAEGSLPDAEPVFQTLGRLIGDFFNQCQKAEELQASADRLLTMINNATSGIFTIDRDGLIITSNPAFQDMVGLSSAECIGKRAEAFFFDDKYIKGTNQSKPVAATLATPTSEKRTLQLINSAGPNLSVELVVTHMESRGQVFHTALVRDITERVEEEERVREFYSIVAHELKAPMTSVAASLSLIENGITGDPGEEARLLIVNARTSCTRLQRLIHDVLDAGKIDAGKMALALAKCSAAGLLEETSASLESYDLASGVKIRRLVEWNGEIFADRDRILQALINLTSNAIKVSPPNSPVDLVVAAAGPNTIKFGVRDYGAGIKEDQRAELFGRFQQLPGPKTSAENGTGLGLYISKAIIDSHGGTIGCQSEPGQGSTFWFTLPINGPQIANGK